MQRFLIAYGNDLHCLYIINYEKGRFFRVNIDLRLIYYSGVIDQSAFDVVCYSLR